MFFDVIKELDEELGDNEAPNIIQIMQRVLKINPDFWARRDERHFVKTDKIYSDKEMVFHSFKRKKEGMMLYSERLEKELGANGYVLDDM
jgi:hypothetical protein